MKKLVMLNLVITLFSSNVFSQNDSCFVDYYSILDMSYCEDPYFQNNPTILNGQWEEFTDRLLKYYNQQDSTIAGVIIDRLNPFKKFIFEYVTLLRVDENSNTYKEQKLTPCEAEDLFGKKD